jgi:hypothetical protein
MKANAICFIVVSPLSPCENPKGIGDPSRLGASAYGKVKGTKE